MSDQTTAQSTTKDPEVSASEESAPTADPPANTTNQPAEEEDDELTIDLDNLKNLKVSELKNILKVLDLPTSGIKTVLIDRIQLHFAQEDEQETVEEKTGDDQLFLPLDTEAEKKPENKESAEEVQSEKKPETELTDEEKAKARAEKFGTKSDEDKKEERAAKFGIVTEKSEEAKKAERAAKFGLTPNTENTSTNTAADKKRARAERFGLNNGKSAPTTTTTTPSSITPKSEAETEKLRKRAARFNLDSSSGGVAPPPSKTCKYDIQEVMKEKVAAGETLVSLSSDSLSAEERRKRRALKFGA